MRYATFMSIVEQAVAIGREQAERAASATLETLAERITGGEARDIAVFLPRELRPALESALEPAEPFGLSDFLRRVAEREGVDEDSAREHARAVFKAIGAAVAPGELRDMVSQLPHDFEPLLRSAGIGRELALPAADLVGRVAELAELDRDQARRVTEAVLETLAIRISAGEVEDLESDIPPDLRPALERGLGVATEAKVMSADEFVDTVAQREHVSLEEAEDHVRAVFAALHEVVSGKEFSDMVAQLSQDYAPLLTAAG
jgi:uncharacterized protein (DUF2267 family)